MEQGDGWETTVTPSLRAFLAERDSLYLGTANALGQPYIQHRGGPPGFVRVLDDRTLAFADFAGNKQYVTVGNLKENDKAFLFFMDYARRQRIKIWGRARVVDRLDGGATRAEAERMLGATMPADYKARGERVIVFAIDAWDANCPQHIPQKIDAADAAEAIAELEARVRTLEAENRALRSAASR